MDIPAAVTQFLAANYPKPRVDPEWLQACYEWVVDDKQLDPATRMPDIIKEVEDQLLSSNLRDSMLHGTGLPINIPDTKVKESRISGHPVLVEIVSITDVGVSAFNLNKVRMVREERQAAGEEEEGEGDVDVDGEGPIPNYPRGMLSFELSDGAVTLKAMEYKSLPQLRLGATPLGYKLMLKDCKVRRGIALLEPACVVLKAHLSEDQEAHQPGNFQRSLHLRLGLPPPEMNMEIQLGPRSPLREITAPAPPLIDRMDDLEEPRRRRVPNASDTQTTLVNPTPTPSSSSSTFFDGPTQMDGQLLDSLPLSPVGLRSIVVDSDDEIQPVRVASSEFGDDDDPFADQDETFWEQVDKAARAQPCAPATSSSNVGEDGMDVIEISDDDKENAPVPTRHVKRRVRDSPEPEDVIELSD